MAESVIKSNTLGKIQITYDESKTFFENVAADWDKFPRGIPFQCTMVLSGSHYVSGYIYPDGTYGRINIFNFNTGNISIIRRYAGAFYYARIEGTSVTP